MKTFNDFEKIAQRSKHKSEAFAEVAEASLFSDVSSGSPILLFNLCSAFSRHPSAPVPF